MKRNPVLVLTIVLAGLLVACGDTGGTGQNPNGKWSEETSETRVCLTTLTDYAKTPQAAISECEAACLEGEGSRSACGGLALAHLQVLVEEIGIYAGFLRPSQTPAEAYTALKLEVERQYEPAIDARTIIKQFIGPIIGALRGIREGVAYSVGGEGDTVVKIDELPLDPAVLAVIYGDAESLSLLGDWTEEELSALGAMANGMLSLLDLVMAHNMVIDINMDVPDFDGMAEIIDFMIQILNDSPNLLLVDAPDTLLDARHEAHAMMSLLAGRDTDLESVSKATPGFLGYVEKSFEAQRDGQTTLDDSSLLKLRDVDGDKTLSRGDNMVTVLKINGEEVTFGFIYPISATLTKEIFQLFGDVTANMDGSGVPARIAPLFNSVLRELGVLASAAQTTGVSLDYMPDVLAFDHDSFFKQFTGLRAVLPRWYHDASTQGVNANYFDGVTPGTGVEYYMAFEREEAADEGHFQWATEVTDATWYEPSSKPGGFTADGVEPAPGYYLLWQDPTFAGFLNVNTTPFLTGNYGMKSDLSTSGEFIAPRDNRMTNAVTNAFIVWALN